MSRHIKMLILFSSFFVGVLLLHTPEAGLFKFNYCLIKQFLGVDCPACGITHAVYATMGLNIHQALEYNLAGPIVALLLWVNWAYYLIVVFFQEAQLSLKREKKLSDIGDWILVGSLMVSWAFKLLRA